MADLNTAPENLRSVVDISGEWAGAAAVAPGACVLCYPTGSGKFEIKDVGAWSGPDALVAKPGVVLGASGASFAIGDDIVVRVLGPVPFADVRGTDEADLSTGQAIATGYALSPGFHASTPVNALYANVLAEAVATPSTAAHILAIGKIAAYYNESDTLSSGSTNSVPVYLCG